MVVICDAYVSELSDISTLAYVRKPDVFEAYQRHSCLVRHQGSYRPEDDMITRVGQTNKLGINIDDSLRSPITWTPPPEIFLLQISMNHTNDLFRNKNGEFRRKVTSLHPCDMQLTYSAI